MDEMSACLVFVETTAKNREYLRQHLPENTRLIACALQDCPPADYADAEVLSVFIHSQVPRATLELMPNLRLIAARSTGFDHIDLQACTERHITVCNVPRYGENTVAEHTFGLILRCRVKFIKRTSAPSPVIFPWKGWKASISKAKRSGWWGRAASGCMSSARRKVSA